ncbi:type II toxin-antitoxin system HicB family antitoxin [Acidithiobacillus ferrooxidans F221]|uniref:type II toxin-antitoxin system HicB family antitoxin n=1 Tax=Acidithiobacillus ferrooxidans TaxID=920 RepID=UPI001C075783|nr:type II toxin-antitoxin system HicB family antitoxin [Acidithiobacillus ferrooxidans]MBU2809480.1 type II toxin-antitoxin system HicB family antitoxin [Acidithiobacillus ferrooxidans F221]
MKLPIVLHTDDGVRYGVTVPGLPGCFSAGNTLDEALDSVREAIDLHLEGMAEEGEPLLEPRSLAEYQADPDYAGGVWAVVEVDVSRVEGKTEKVNITLPRNLIRRIDEAARTRGSSRSGFLAEAARQALRKV